MPKIPGKFLSPRLPQPTSALLRGVICRAVAGCIKSASHGIWSNTLAVNVECQHLPNSTRSSPRQSILKDRSRRNKGLAGKKNFHQSCN